MPYPIRYWLLLLLIQGGILLNAQDHRDSVNRSLAYLQELAEAGNFEDAQIEAGLFREFLQQQQIICPADAVPLLTAIYLHNEDKAGAIDFLSNAMQDCRRDPEPGSRVRLLTALATAYLQWRMPDEALQCYRQLLAARDSLTVQQINSLRLEHQTRMDSLARRQQRANAEQERYFLLPREAALPALGLLSSLFLGLILYSRRTSRRLKKRLNQRELENDFLRSQRFTATRNTENPEPEPVQSLQPSAYVQTAYARSAPGRAAQSALLIEPNRQIVLYLKSLLVDRFNVLTASTAAEGLQLAANELPDLIVCDAVLNGISGIEVVRKIKLSERTNHIPVILLTQHVGSEGQLDVLRAGADAWFSRPVLDEEFDAQVSRLLDAGKSKHEQFARFLNLFYSENRLGLNDNFLAKVVDLIDRHLSDPDFMADDLARKLQLHNQHFTKKLLALTGKEPTQLIRDLRLEKARALLEKRAGTPQAIAELVGFSSTGTFALAFKEYFGENTMLLQMPDR